MHPLRWWGGWELRLLPHPVVAFLQTGQRAHEVFRFMCRGVPPRQFAIPMALIRMAVDDWRRKVTAFRFTFGFLLLLLLLLGGLARGRRRRGRPRGVCRLPVTLTGSAAGELRGRQWHRHGGPASFRQMIVVGTSLVPRLSRMNNGGGMATRGPALGPGGKGVPWEIVQVFQSWLLVDSAGAF